MNPKITVFLFFSLSLLVGCGSNTSSSQSSSAPAVTPVYQGMEISHAPTPSTRHPKRSYGDPIDQENPFALPVGSRIEDHIATEMPLGEFTPLDYYAERNEQIIVTVKVLNPTGYEILSFTLNGYKYQSYQFEDGSDSENLLLKTTIPEISGTYTYTIDQIKYVDGTEIKDVIIEGNQTVEVGIRYPEEPTMTVSDVVLTQSSYEMSLGIVDPYGVMNYEDTEVRAFLFDGTEIIQNTKVISTMNLLSFDTLAGDTLYQYAIVGVYDGFDGEGPVYHDFHTEAFYTRPYVQIDEVTPTKTSVTFVLSEEDPNSVGTITAIALYHGETLVESLSNLEIRTFENLLSNNDYTLEVTFTYNLDDGVGERTNVVRHPFTTTAKIVPTGGIENVISSKTGVTFDVSIDDPDEVGILTLLELWKDGSVEQTAHSLTDRGFDGLLSNNAYMIKGTYTYDLNDGVGERPLIAVYEFTTLNKTIPSIEVEEIVPTQTSMSFEISVDDPDSLSEITKIELYDGATLVESLSDISLRTFSGLTINHGYQIKVTYTYDLNDGEGQHTATVTENAATLAHEITITSLDILNTTNPKVGEEVHVNISLNNPDSIVITAFIINDQVVDVVAGDVTVSAIVVFVPEFTGGLYEVVIDAIQYLSYGIILEQPIASSFTDQILILGDIQILSVSMLDGLDYLNGADTANEFVVVELGNPTGYDVSGMKIVFAPGGNATTYSTGEVTMMDSTHAKVQWKGDAGGFGIATIEVISLTYGIPGYSYSTKLFSGHKASFRWVLSDTIYLIHNATELADIDSGYVYRLANDIDMTGVSWTPLDAFDGIFDGNNHTISNLALVSENTATENEDIGLFSLFSGNVYDLSFTNAYVSAKNDGQITLGIFCGNFNVGNAENIHVYQSNLYADAPRTSVGGLFGSSSGKMVNCSTNNTSIHSDSTLGANIGGIAGYATSYSSFSGVSHCQTSGVNLYITSLTSSVGGIIGYASLPISECLVSEGIIDVEATTLDPADGPSLVAGIVGSGRGVSDCLVKDSTLILACAYDGYLAGIVSQTWGFDNIERCMIDGVMLTAEMPGNNNSGSSGNSQVGLISSAPSNGQVSGSLAVDSSININTTNTVLEYGIAPNTMTVINCFVYEDVMVTSNGNPWTHTDPMATLEQLNHAAFYTTTLGWNPEIWNLLLLNYSNGLRPTLMMG